MLSFSTPDDPQPDKKRDPKSAMTTRNFDRKEILIAISYQSYL
jgi:hypothetical protein